MIYGGQAHGGFCKIPFCCNCAHSVDGRHGDVTDAVEAGAAGQRRDGAEQPGGLAQLGRSARQQHGRAQAPGRRLVSAGLCQRSGVRVDGTEAFTRIEEILLASAAHGVLSRGWL